MSEQIQRRNFDPWKNIYEYQGECTEVDGFKLMPGLDGKEDQEELK